MTRHAQPFRMEAITPEWFMRHDPEMPREVAEFQVRRMRADQERSEARSLAEMGVGSPAELESLPAAEVAIRHFRAMHPASVLRASLAEAGQELPPEFPLDVVAAPRYEILGSVMEGDDRAHVLYRMRLGPAFDPAPDGEELPPELAPVGVATLKRTPEGWRLRYAHDLLGLLNVGISVGPDEESPED